MAITFGDFLSIFTTNDASGGRAIKATFDNGVDDIQNYLTKNDPAGGRAIKIVNVGAPLGPQFWTEAYTATTQATSSWTATGAATNINAAIIPKGTGAIVAQIPDGTFVGGNARGVNAVDFQRVRFSFSGATQVASGARSFIGNGENNAVTGTNSGVLCGESNGVSGNNSAIVAGTNNSISGGDKRSFIGGGYQNAITNFPLGVGIVSGQSNTAGGDKSFIGGGQSNTASGQWSTIAGGQSNTASAIYSFVGGGSNNVAGFTNDTICGGDQNRLTGSNNSGYRFIGGGARNTIQAEQTNSTVICGGNGNTIYFGSAGGFIGGGGVAAFPGGNFLTGTNSAIVGGQENRIGSSSPINYATYCFIGGGFSNTIQAESDYSVISGGANNTINGTIDYAVITGGYQGVASLYAQQVHASGRFSANGDAQAHELIWRRAITGTAQTELFLDGTSIAAILPGTNSVWNGIIDITSICTVVGDGTTVVGHVAATAYKVTIKRIGTTTSLVGGVQEIGITNADASMATAVFTIDNNDTNESLRVRFTPPSTAGSTTVIRAVATFRGTQIQY